MKEFILLDLFCGAGGCSQGYKEAGFTTIIGVDIKPQKRYPFKFMQGDAIEYLKKYGKFFDGIHASPPCQKYSHSHTRRPDNVYPDLVGTVRELLIKSGKSWVIENVPGAPIRSDFKLCGCQFGLELRRERWFETNWVKFSLIPPHKHIHTHPVVSVFGHGGDGRVTKRLGYRPTIEHYKEAMGIDWMVMSELSQAIPPAYTRHIGKKWIQYLKTGKKQTSC